MLGITSMQLEIPRSVRKMICLNPEKYINGMAEIIVQMYTDVIVPL